MDINKTVAFPRNRLHLRFLSQNSSLYDEIWFRDKELYEYYKSTTDSYVRVYYIGREERLESLSIISTIIKNIFYYKNLRKLLSDNRVGRAILFLDSEPLEIFIESELGSEKIELWEEGLYHYLENDRQYLIIRRIAQLLLGYHYTGLFTLTINIKKVKVRDRFYLKNLNYSPLDNFNKILHIPAVAFIANALVDDKKISLEKYVDAVLKLQNSSGLDLHYFPHPRENKEVVERIAKEGVQIVRSDDNIKYLTVNQYTLCLSPFSSVLLELSENNSVAYCPGLFNLKKFENQLVKSTKFNFKVLVKFSDLECFLK